MVKVKICGMTNLSDVLHAAEAGADALGFIFAPRSKRLVTPEQARELSLAAGPSVARVGVFMNQPLDEVLRTAERARMSAVQLHGVASGLYIAAVAEYYPVLRVLRPNELGEPYAAGVTLMVDAPEPGSGQPLNWAEWPAGILKGGWLAGGLGPDNVAQAIRLTRPAGVDAVSKLEAAPRIKDPQAVTAFLRAARAAAVDLS